MKRKIIRQGAGGCTIFLPIRWVREQQLNPGDQVEVTDKGNALMVSGKGSATRITRLEIAENPTQQYLRSIIASSYKAGYEEIELIFEGSPPIALIDQVIMTFTGLEVVSTESNKIVVRSFLKSEKGELQNLMVKLFQINREMLRILLEETKTYDVENVKHLKLNARRLRDHCLRIIHAQTYGEDNSYDYYDLVSQLEKLATDISMLAEDCVQHKRVVPQKAENIREVLVKLYEVFLKHNATKAETLYNEIRKLSRDDMLKELQQKSTFETVHYYHIMQRFLHMSSRLLSVATMHKKDE